MATPSTAPAPQRALAVVAHPDDVDFGAAGTVAGWTAAGTAVTYCICTSGQAGAPADADRTRVAELRRAEQRAAAAAVGVSDVRFLDHEDGRVVADLQLRRDITEVIRTVRPEVVLTHSPEINWSHIAISHPDHRAVGEATLAAVYPDARNEFAHPELSGLAPWTVRALWLSESTEERINRAVDVTGHFDAKLAALAAHRSQVERFDDLRETIRHHLERNAAEHGMPGELAEVFQVVDTS
ncbi:PIG-L family deacetylase [Saccharopolyspora sp. HNM0983]|uniref:PIG-L family deacetylase n=1 Tax=Saccharopolyspora montiporae TaxID=2781240 RepID=A0A929B8B0_9PSEU|nr:PIG-L deacetylase family protein [Saccharopolyspora sp. HNM0983]MBE9375077.1 PIG-L family deacetylase [Saccharopolyspora sp. HNM0983]